MNFGKLLKAGLKFAVPRLAAAVVKTAPSPAGSIGETAAAAISALIPKKVLAAAEKAGVNRAFLLDQVSRAVVDGSDVGVAFLRHQVRAKLAGALPADDIEQLVDALTVHAAAQIATRVKSTS